MRTYLLAFGVMMVGAACGDQTLQRERTPNPGPTAVVPPGTWSEAALVNGLTGYSSRALVAVDLLGNALAAWQFQPNEDGGWQNQGVWASRFNGTLWSTPVVVAQGYQGINSLRLVSNDSGSAVLTWLAQDDVSYGIMASRFEVESGWSQPTTLAPGGDSPRTAINDTGDSLVVWRSTTGGLGARLYQPNSGWLEPTAIATGDISEWWSSLDSTHAVFDVSLDPAGRALVVWAQHGATSEVWSTRGSQAIGSLGPISWAPAERLASYDADMVFKVWARLDEAGNASTLWARRDAQYVSYGLSMTRAATVGAWMPAAEFAGPIAAYYGMFDNEPKAAVNRQGDWITLWREEVDGMGRIVTQRYAPATGWRASEVVIDDHEPPIGCTFEGMAEAVDVAIDDNGNAVTVWEERASDSYAIRVAASEHTGAAWGDRVSLNPDAAGMAQSPMAALSLGAGFSVWTRGEELAAGGWAQSVWASRLQRGEGGVR